VFSETNSDFCLIYNINCLDFITEVESVYSAVRTESLHNTYVSPLSTGCVRIVAMFVIVTCQFALFLRPGGGQSLRHVSSRDVKRAVGM